MVKNYNNYNYAKSLSGMNIFQDPDTNQTIYCNPFTRKSYILDDDCVSSFSTWRLRLPLAIMFAGIIAMLKFDIKIAIAAGLVIYIVSTIFFYAKFLPTLTVTQSFKKPVYKSIFHSIAARFTRIKLLQALATFLALAIIVFVAVFSGKVGQEVRSAAIAIIVLSVVAGAFTYLLIHLKFTDPQLIKEEEERY